MPQLLKVESLTKRFGGLEAVSNVSFELHEGQILAVIGPNGAGKTTLFNMLTGLIKATSGKAYYQEKELNNLPPHRITEVGICRTFQNILLFGNMTVLDNVVVGFHCRTKPGFLGDVFHTGSCYKEWQAMKDRAIELLEMFGLYEFRDEMACNLPYGQQRRLEIARALASQPQLLLLDEPAAGLNIGETDRMMRQIDSLRSDLGKTILLIEHDMNLVMGISDHIVVLDHGRKIAEGKPEQVQANEQVIEAYLGKGYKKNARDH